MDRYERTSNNERDPEHLGEESDLRGETTAHHAGDNDPRNDPQHSDTFDTTRDPDADRYQGYGNRATMDPDVGATHDVRGNYSSETPFGDEGSTTHDRSGLDDTGALSSDYTSTSGLGSHDSVETRFGVERPEMNTDAGLRSGEDPLVSDRDGHSSSIATANLGRDDACGSTDTSLTGRDNTYDTTDTSHHQPTGTVGYGGDSEGHSFGESTHETTGSHDSSSKNSDSTMGKLMEKAGDVLNKDDLAEKGRAKREAASYEGGDTSRSE